MTIEWKPSARGALATLRANFETRKNSISIPDTATTTCTKVWTPAEYPNRGPMMPLSLLTYAQIGLWDNADKPETFVDPKTGQMRKRYKGLRYKVSIEGWTVPASLIQKRSGAQFSRGVQLRQAGEFELKIVDVNRSTGKFTAAFADELRSLIARNDPEDLYGVLSDRHGGFRYFEHQYVHVRFTTDDEGATVPEVTLHVDGQTLVADQMTAKFISPKQRGAGLRYHQYVDRCGYAEHVASQRAARLAQPVGGSQA